MASSSSPDPATLCELPLENGGKCFIEVQTTREGARGEFKSLDLRAIQGVSVWSGGISKTDKPAHKKGMSDSDWLRKIHCALTDPSDEYLCSFDSGTAKLVVKQEIGKAKSKMAEVSMSTDEEGISGLLLRVVSSQAALIDKAKMLESANRKLERERDEFKKMAKDATNSATRSVDELAEDFLPLLNTKKQKISELEGELKRLRKREGGGTSVKEGEDDDTDADEDEDMYIKPEAGMEDYGDGNDGSEGDDGGGNGSGGDSGDDTENDINDEDQDIYTLGTFTTSAALNSQFADSDDGGNGPRRSSPQKKSTAKGKVKVEFGSDDELLNTGDGSSSSSSSSSTGSYRRKRTKPAKKAPPPKRVKVERANSGQGSKKKGEVEELDGTQDGNESSQCSMDDLLG
jgi:hypothetical protein